MEAELLDEEVHRGVIDGRIAEIHTCLPGRVEAFDWRRAKASVKPLVKRRFKDGRVLSLPVVVNVPVVFPAAGGFALTWPLQKGDTGTLFFAERSLERWLASGGEQEPGDPRKYALKDGIFYPGLRPFSVAALADNGTDVLLQFKGARIRVTAAGKFAIGKGGNELLDLVDLALASIQTAMTALNAATDTDGDALVSSNGAVTAAAAQIAAQRARLAAIKGAL